MPILLQQGPWVSSAPGVIEAIEILESAEQTEDKPLTEREAKLFHCKEVRNQSQMFGCRPPSALSALTPCPADLAKELGRVAMAACKSVLVIETPIVCQKDHI